MIAQLRASSFAPKALVLGFTALISQISVAQTYYLWSQGKMATVEGDPASAPYKKWSFAFPGHGSNRFPLIFNTPAEAMSMVERARDTEQMLNRLVPGARHDWADALAPVAVDVAEPTSSGHVETKLPFERLEPEFEAEAHNLKVFVDLKQFIDAVEAAANSDVSPASSPGGRADFPRLRSISEQILAWGDTYARDFVTAENQWRQTFDLVDHDTKRGDLLDWQQYFGRAMSAFIHDSRNSPMVVRQLSDATRQEDPSKWRDSAVDGLQSLEIAAPNVTGWQFRNNTSAEAAGAVLIMVGGANGDQVFRQDISLKPGERSPLYFGVYGMSVTLKPKS